MLRDKNIGHDLYFKSVNENLFNQLRYSPTNNWREYLQNVQQNIVNKGKREEQYADVGYDIERMGEEAWYNFKAREERDRAALFQALGSLAKVAASFIPGIGPVVQGALLGSGISGLGNISRAPSMSNWSRKPGNFGKYTYTPNPWDLYYFGKGK